MLPAINIIIPVVKVIGGFVASAGVAELIKYLDRRAIERHEQWKCEFDAREEEKRRAYATGV